MAHKGCLDCKYNHSTMDEHECLYLSAENP